MDLADNRLRGEIPPELGNLEKLEELILNLNQLSGEIPPELGNLVNLTYLWLWGNQLSGEIPAELGGLANLQNLWLAQNQLSGEVPPELGSLEDLLYLRLAVNHLSGTIPPELGNLAKLETLELWDNRLDGEIPSELGKLMSLRQLHFIANRLNGEIPPELGNLVNLEELGLGLNRLSGEIPLELGYLANLKVVRLTKGNVLTGCVPQELREVSDSDFSDLGLSFCATPAIPMAILVDRAALVVLYYATSGPNWTESENWLSNRPLGDWHGVSTDGNGRVIQLDLTNNQLSGEIPAELGKLSYLEVLRLETNRLRGEIPRRLGYLTDLKELTLSENGLTGEIPLHLGNLANLELLQLTSNDLAGCIPEGLRNVSDNDFLDLSLQSCDPAPFVAEITECSLGDDGFEDLLWVTIRSIVTAKRAHYADSLFLMGYANGEFLSFDFSLEPGYWQQGESKEFTVSGLMEPTESPLSCDVELEWSTLE